MQLLRIKHLGLLLLLTCTNGLHAEDQSLTVERLIDLDARNALAAAGIQARPAAGANAVAAFPSARAAASGAPRSRNAPDFKVNATWGVSGDKSAEIELFRQQRTIRVGDAVAEWRVSEIADGCVRLDKKAQKRGQHEALESIRNCVAPSTSSTLAVLPEEAAAWRVISQAPLPALPAISPPAPGTVPVPAR